MTVNRFGLQFHHFGLAVREYAPALRFLENLGYRAGPVHFDPLQNVNLMMARHPTMPAVEVIFPAEGAGPVSKLLASHQNGLVYHLCFTTENLSAALAQLEDAGVRPFQIVAPKPAILFGGERVSFYMVPGMGVIEIIEGVGDGC